MRFAALIWVSCTIWRITSFFLFLLGRCSIFFVCVLINNSAKHPHGLADNHYHYVITLFYTKHGFGQTNFIRRERQYVFDTHLIKLFTG